MDAIPATIRSLPRISTVEMHTTGEPTRIIYAGYPPLSGTLLSQRAQAQAYYDSVRTRLMLEPCGHRDMYGALLRPSTEHVDAGKAHMGVLFMTNDGYSTMCGHATIALGRFLVDTHDTNVFPKRGELAFNPTTKTTEVILHAPCGLVLVTVPTTPDGKKCDPARSISFLSTPSFAAGVDIEIPIPEPNRWPQLHHRKAVTASLAYGGAYYLLLSASELGFSPGTLSPPFDLSGLNVATRQLKAATNADLNIGARLKHPEHDDLSFLYSVIVVDNSTGVAAPGTKGVETGLCFFADQQLDRSPTGSGVSARVALAYAKGERKLGEEWTYHSIVSNASGGKGGFVGTAVKEVEVPGVDKGVIVKVEGMAYYTGWAEFIVENEDGLGEKGLDFQQLAAVEDPV